MKRIKIILNPVAGRGTTKAYIDELSLHLLDAGFTISKYTTRGRGDAKEAAIKAHYEEKWDLLIAAGGDGTLSEVVSGLLEVDSQLPVTVFSAGTMNDFGYFLGIPRKPEKFVDLIRRWDIHKVDAGSVHKDHFINVVSTGVLSSVAHNTNVEVKNFLGPLAYYLEGLRTISTKGIPSHNIIIEADDFSYSGEFILFLISNSSNIAGFSHMAPMASIEDGLFDCILIKKAPLYKLFEIFLKLSNGEHINDPNVAYFQAEHITFTTDLEVDIDGDLGGKGTTHVEMLHEKLNFLY